MAVQAFDVGQLEELALGGMFVPLIRMYTESLPDINIQVGDQPYLYDRSCPIKGHSAILPGQIRQALAEGKQPLLIERPDRFYIYYSAEHSESTEESGTAEAGADSSEPADEADAPE